jgi:hypothetical protein
MKQVDGNVSPTSSTAAAVTRPLCDSAIIQAGASVSVPWPGDIQLQYSLNSVNQAKRLFENSARPNLDIRYNNPQMINGQQHATNVSIDCNSGVYLSAVKPALQAISKGWQTEVSSTLITCADISDRSEMSGRKVSTKLTLFLTENRNISSKYKVVLHFYHTSSTLQAQGTSILPCGTSSPVWLVKNFLEPLANKHANQNSVAIDAINTDIRQSQLSMFMCGLCKASINPRASHPKDQELSCTNCGKLFHKKCTDRKKTTANWKKSPWYCHECVLGPQPQLPTPDLTSAASRF